MNAAGYDGLYNPMFAASARTAAARCLAEGGASNVKAVMSSEAPPPAPPYPHMSFMEQGTGGYTQQQQELLRKRSDEFAGRADTQNRLVYDIRDPVRLEHGGPWTLLFSSEFESGNLERVYQMYGFEYDLELASDANARGSTQWYNFSITNARPGVYQFNLVNFVKPTSLYNRGLRPCFYSRKAKRWSAVGRNVCYFKNRQVRRDMRSATGADCYVLSFALELTDPKDVYYLAYCYPFTYTDLQIYLRSLEEASRRQGFYKLKREVLCETVQGRRCDLIKISKKEKKKLKAGEKAEKKYVVVTGRVHPGETNSSWVVKGMLDFLTSNKVWSQDLLEQYRFVFIPILNPDGVAIGNYRCDTNGYDLNRCWKTPSETLHPTIYHTKAYIRKLLSKGEVAFFFDMHGHSRKQHLFMYGNSGKGSRYRLKGAPRHPHAEKVLPYMLGKLCGEFSFQECSFHITKKKEGTARVVNWAELGVALSYTIEASFLGPTSLGDANFDINQYQELGMMVLRSVHEYSSPSQAFVNSCVAELCALYSSKDAIEGVPRYCTLTADSSPMAGLQLRREPEVAAAAAAAAAAAFDGIRSTASGTPAPDQLRELQRARDAEASRHGAAPQAVPGAAALRQLAASAAGPAADAGARPALLADRVHSAALRLVRPAVRPPHAAGRRAELLHPVAARGRRAGRQQPVQCGAGRSLRGPAAGGGAGRHAGTVRSIRPIPARVQGPAG
eukprot:TRINITY_DN717_c1_g1_i6.p1 TRINITY_DN717_c1_g1~~TRINITY_DN717_c1_g1_i6.p1  ORF type:complete len:728 (+),score=189.15 TRINITY_DN717_c1_g1_i6:1075-3258(+)